MKKFLSVMILLLLFYVIGCERIREKLSLLGKVKIKTETMPPFVTQLENGMGIWLQENHANPMVAVIVVIGAGSRNETWEINGASHMLEHLLFNGTERRTQPQLYDEMEMTGGYFNATTRRDHTAFLALVDKDQLDKGMDILSDMLFHSSIPDDKFEKEKGIVIEEIGKDRDRTEEFSSRFFNQVFYKGSPYSMSVTGTNSSITNLTREQIEYYYKTYYVPNNMTAIVIGDFQKKPMIEILQKYLGSYQTQDIASTTSKPPVVSVAEGIQVQPANTQRLYLNMGIQAPLPNHPDFFELFLFNQWISNGDPSLLKRHLNASKEITFYDVTSELVFSDNESSIQLSFTTDPQVEPTRVVEAVKREMKKLSQQRISDDEFNSLLTSLESNEIYLSEKLHYYGLTIAPRVAAGGVSFATNWLKNIKKVKAEDLSKSAGNWIKDSLFISTALIPYPESSKTVAKSESRLTRAVLENGLTLLVDENQDSRVLAMHVLAKNRSAQEPEGKTGIVDVLHQILKYGTVSDNTDEWQNKLKSIGANVKVADDPTIPYDDFYTTPENSYIRFETIDTFYNDGIRYLARMIQEPRLTEEVLQKVKEEKLDRIKTNQESGRETNRRLYNEALFGNSPWSKPVEGTPGSIRDLSLNDVKDFHSRYYSPNNLVISIVTNLPTGEILKIFQKYFNEKPSKSNDNPFSIPLTKAVTEKRVKLGKQQSNISWGYTFLADSTDYAACEIMNSLISGQLAYHLREEKGLAYSLGSSINFSGKMGWFTVTMGTRPQNISESLGGIEKEVEKFREFAFSESGVQKAKNSYIGRLVMRRLSRINAAYYYGLYESQGYGYDYFTKHLNDLKKVTVDDVQRVAKKYLQTKNYVLAVTE